jgi:hypothetical protein
VCRAGRFDANGCFAEEITRMRPRMTALKNQTERKRPMIIFLRRMT